MKNTATFITCFMFFAALLPCPVFSSGQMENEQSDKTIVRIADNMPGLITPGVWNGQVFSLNSSVYDYLVSLDPETGELNPSLATSWRTDGGDRWEISLRKGVRFHDGTSFTADDVIFTLERTQDPSVGHSKKEDFSTVTKIEKIDEYTVAIYLDTVLPTFMYQMTDFNMAMLSSGYDYDKLGETAPMGTGPFKVESLISKESALLVKNEDYWEEGKPYIDELHIYFNSDVEVSLAMLLNDKVDIVPFITPVMVDRLKEEEELKVVIPYMDQRFISMAADRAPFEDNRVRLALKYAMDPQILARATTLTLHEGIEYSETPIMSALPQYSEIPYRKRDVEKAKQLLSEAGYPDGLTIELTYASDHVYNQNIAQTIKELAKDAGIEIILKGYPRDIYFAQYWLNVPLSLTTWGVRVDPSMLLRLAFVSDAPWNESKLAEPYLDELIDSISREVHNDKRQQLYDELQNYFYENGPLLNIQVPYLVAMKENIEGYEQPVTMLPVYKNVTVDQVSP
ncbi:MAG: ABC transporter substrate-binding protein [Sphaerochaetaceae bacterium]|nr:ABC transporter substrate-binding protein [Sphaerochaetaceae bacterium]